VAERKNIFLIGRRGHEGDEDQLTEMLAFLWQEDTQALDRWLDSLGLPTNVSAAEIGTQFTIPSGKRPDITIRSSDAVTLVESKLSSGFGETQIADYVEFLAAQEGRRALVLLTQRPEVVPGEYGEVAKDAGVVLIPTRWQEMAERLGDPGEETLAGDFIQLLIREGLVKPRGFSISDWEIWNAGYNVSLRIDALLAELDPHVVRILPGAKGRGGGSKFWTWRVWSTGAVDVGLAFLAAEWTDRPRTSPGVHCWVLNRQADEVAAMNAVGVNAANRSHWTESAQVRGSYGLNPFGPAIGRHAQELFSTDAFDQQVSEASSFVRETIEYFTSRGYLPPGS
jgi:hypothetical protein